MDGLKSILEKNLQTVNAAKIKECRSDALPDFSDGFISRWALTIDG